MAEKSISNEDAQGEIEVGFQAVRDYVDATNYGRLISNDECREVAVAVVTAVEKYRSGTKI